MLDPRSSQRYNASMLRLLNDGPSHGPPLLLAHGAGAPMDSPFMNAIADRVASAGIRVTRFEFDYMARRREDGSKRGPDRAPKLIERFEEALQSLGPPEGVVIGGKSMGGRIASMIADHCGVAGVVCLGYPFHPPGKPEKLRIAHLQSLRTPTLIVQGTRDPFGKPGEVRSYGLSPAIELVWVPDGDHSFAPRKKSGRTDERNLDEAAEAIIAFLGRRR
jgi:predicted alpha/beta-hydrolase family hydrolase